MRQISRNRESQGTASTILALEHVHKGMFWLFIDAEGAGSLWAVSSVHWCDWDVSKRQLSKPINRFSL